MRDLFQMKRKIMQLSLLFVYRLGLTFQHTISVVCKKYLENAFMFATFDPISQYL